MSVDRRRSAPAAERNREPIAARMAPLLGAAEMLLDIASGSGQHAALFAERHPALVVQPSDPDEDARASADAWAEHLALQNMRRALDLDVTRAAWWADVSPLRPDVVFCANMIHIAAWAACEGLFEGAEHLLAPSGVLALYGPFLRDDVETAPSNLAFDRSLRARDPAWGVRALADVDSLARARGLEREAVHEMPAHNLIVVFRRV